MDYELLFDYCKQQGLEPLEIYEGDIPQLRRIFIERNYAQKVILPLYMARGELRYNHNGKAVHYLTLLAQCRSPDTPQCGTSPRRPLVQ